MSEERTADYEGVDEPAAVPEVPEGTVEIRLEDLSILPLEPGDIIVLKTRAQLTQHDGARARELIMSKAPGHEVLIIAGDADLVVLRPPRVVAVDDPEADLNRFDDDSAARAWARARVQASIDLLEHSAREPYATAEQRNYLGWAASWMRDHLIGSERMRGYFDARSAGEFLAEHGLAPSNAVGTGSAHG